MKIVVLGSGSDGNSTLLEIGKVKILIDCGFTYSTLEKKLNEINVSPKDIDYILITHDHGDHINGLKTFLKRNHPILCISKILEEYSLGYEYNNTKYYEDEFLIENIFIKTLPTSHDAHDSYGFLIEHSNESLVYITDTGYIHERNLEVIKNKKYYLIESNHDVEMLMNGRYPLYLQKRILSNKGHLSNEITGMYLSKIIGPNTKKIVLCHLSKDNNTKEICLSTIYNFIKDFNKENILVATQDELLEVDK